MHLHAYTTNHVFPPGVLVLAFLAAVAVIVALHFTVYEPGASGGTTASGGPAVTAQWTPGSVPHGPLAGLPQITEARLIALLGHQVPLP